MRAQDGDPKYEASQDLPAFSYAQYAELIGLKGIEVTDPEQIASAWDQAIANNCPTVLDFHTDPDIPPFLRIFLNSRRRPICLQCCTETLMH
ncbi:hypothetical protein HORIV_56980 [Vreelandella olivaria]|uniref:Thiamine pyrophosphate enzyme TPP-binding domain-containing protein n=1 Tax=Vreelandella olivaria TaxID=390919 RepID=A0ABM7GRF1_9GAMM|nr:hypothetical protein HORIV_56980 [Halomonas olivaria]